MLYVVSHGERVVEKERGGTDTEAFTGPSDYVFTLGSALYEKNLFAFVFPAVKVWCLDRRFILANTCSVA